MKKNSTRLISGTMLLFFGMLLQQVQAQSWIGLWEVTEVQVGGKSRTPGAKWIEFKEDHTYLSGNGLLQNGNGTWEYSEQLTELKMHEELGLKDPFGPFKLALNENGSLQWVRTEEGEQVTVLLERRSTKPKSMADQLRGLWQMKTAELNGVSQINNTKQEVEQSYLFLRWDRVAIERDFSGKRERGYWHIHSHRPLLTLLGLSSNEEQWKVEVSENQLTLMGISVENKGIERIYMRLEEFPN